MSAVEFVGEVAPEFALRTEELAYRYGKVEVFSGVSFVLAAGEVAFLTGPNGQGSPLFCVAWPGGMRRAKVGWNCAGGASMAPTAHSARWWHSCPTCRRSTTT